MKNKILFYIIVCSLALNAGFIGVYGFTMLHRNTSSAPQNCPFTSEYTHLYTALGMSQQQLETIEPLARNFHKNTEIISVKIVEQRNILVTEMAKENVDKDSIDTIHRRISDMQSKMQQLVVSHILDMKNVMTHEQRVKFFSAMQRSFQSQNFMNY